MIKQKQKGFTLLELLIVIGIIGILASITIISYPSYTKKARLANALRFSDNVRGSLQQDMVAWWKFDETSGTIAKDTWWNQLNGTVSGATWVPGIKNNALSFDGVNDYVIANRIAGLTNQSICAWAKSDNGSDGTIISNGVYMNFLGIAGGKWYAHIGSAYDNTYSKDSVVLGSWHFICGIYNATAVTFKLYVDGVYQSQLSGIPHWDYPYGNLIIGGRQGDGYAVSGYFNGLVDDVQIYSAALPVAVIQQHYADGLKTHQNLAIK